MSRSAMFKYITCKRCGNAYYEHSNVEYIYCHECTKNINISQENHLEKIDVDQTKVTLKEPNNEASQKNTEMLSPKAVMINKPINANGEYVAICDEYSVVIKQKVFISYVKEDEEYAKKLWNELGTNGFDPWLAGENLLPGQQWETYISEAIEQSHFFIALLSKKSVRKKSYFQKEIRRALEVLETIPEKEIYFLPVRLDNCNLSNQIKRIHRVDLFPISEWDKGYKKICLALSKKNA